MTVLVGDVGATKTQIAIAEGDGQKWLLRNQRRYASREYQGLGEILTQYLASLEQPPKAAALAIAGPVANDRCEATNMPWHLDARALEAATGIARVRLLNDLEAIAWGIPGLDDDQRLTLQAGDLDARGNIAVVAPGTGLGQAGLFWDGKRHRPFATEGGHTDFAPTDAREFALLESLQARFGRVSWERVASGMGIENLYGFLLQYRGAAHHPQMAEVLAQQDKPQGEQTGDVAATVAALAATGDCDICQETMAWFMPLLGREVGNSALKLMARGGVYLAGGILPKNVDLLRSGGFLQGFVDKGRMRGLLEAMPVHLVLEEGCALIGAARFLSDPDIC
ncbi:glucokinase [Thiorhodovibrio frisius]|uniref:Glucokinase n=1 Tax=Thiorhodovibrio frisius TaxID=631362 RepID=H8Z3L6_9GAMM|nr:glucokinase [Thiorhodovibrio frisius]EIC20005.1 glucokinase [Thiorhodovibrio frisius]WPL20734.1 Glucokinase [Thiorhodovibrio frisius]